MPVKSDRPDSAAPRSRAAGHVQATTDGSTDPVVILSYAHSGGRLVQQALADGTTLAPTVATGILPMCEVAATAWAEIDNRRAQAMSRLAILSIRDLVNAQLTVVLAASVGKRRWCELAISAPSTAQTFLQIFPAARFVCVHRACTDVIAAAITAQPWGVGGPAMWRFIVSYPGNSVAAIAAYWASATEQLLAFEAANPQATIRVRYEDVAADAECALKSVRSSLQLNQHAYQQSWPGLPDPVASARESRDREHTQIPVEMIPTDLRKRIDHLGSQLGYPPAAQSAGLPKAAATAGQ
jgi:Sulfotransferase family